LLKATDRTAVGEDDSIGGRTFIAVRRFHPKAISKKREKKKKKADGILSQMVSGIARALDEEAASCWPCIKGVRDGVSLGMFRRC
jgi:hypothetical protein